jgi:hypothetical protein
MVGSLGGAGFVSLRRSMRCPATMVRQRAGVRRQTELPDEVTMRTPTNRTAATEQRRLQ